MTIGFILYMVLKSLSFGLLWKIIFSLKGYITYKRIIKDCFWIQISSYINVLCRIMKLALFLLTNSYTCYVAYMVNSEYTRSHNFNKFLILLALESNSGLGVLVMTSDYPKTGRLFSFVVR